ncbi:hypothetical protein SPPR111872_03595 [Sphingobacterium prati]
MVKLQHSQNDDNLTWFGCRIIEQKTPLDDLEQKLYEWYEKNDIPSGSRKFKVTVRVERSHFSINSVGRYDNNQLFIRSSSKQAILDDSTF